MTMHFLSRDFPHTRLRRLRTQEFTRKLVQENHLSPHDLIYPLFICEGKNIRQPIGKMPGIDRMSLDMLLKELDIIIKLNIPAIALFPVINSTLKTADGREAYNPHGLLQTAARDIKKAFGDTIGIIADVALDPFTTHGHDGICNAHGEILNDETNVILAQQALSQAEAGVDIVAPSDMMDGRIKFIREILEKNKFKHTKILAYSAKYTSAYYGPFREALGTDTLLKTDKKSYQLNPGNTDEALHEIALDIQEGADMIMVKPGMPYLDIIRQAKDTFGVPTFAYQVSGEYAMHKAAILNGWLDEKAVILESLLSFKRAGADAVLTYFAKDAAAWLNHV